MGVYEYGSVSRQEIQNFRNSDKRPGGGAVAVKVYWAQQPERLPAIADSSWGFGILCTSAHYMNVLEHPIPTFLRDYVLVTENDVYGLVANASSDPGPVLAMMLNEITKRAEAAVGRGGASFRL